GFGRSTRKRPGHVAGVSCAPPSGRRRGAMLRDEILVWRHGRRAAGDDLCDPLEDLLHVSGRHVFGAGIVACGQYALAGQHEKPALLAESFGRIANEAPVAAEELETLLQAVGQLHLAAVAPEFPFAPGLAVVSHEEVADA